MTPTTPRSASHNRPTFTPIVLCLASLLLLLVAVYLFRASNNDLALLPYAGLSVAVAIGLVGLLARYQPLPNAVRWPIQPDNTAISTHRSRYGSGVLVGVGVLFELVVIEINGSFLQLELLKQVHYLIQLGLLLGGVALIVAGLSQWDWRWPEIARRDGILLGGILLLALVLRLVMIDTTIHRFVDEINFIDAIVRLRDEPSVAILRPFSDVTAFTWLYPIGQHMTSSLLGTNLVGLRAASAILGTLTVASLYFLAKSLLHDRKLALLAALLLATFPPHLHFSRIGLNNIADPFFGLTALAFLIRGLQSNRRSDYVVAGAMLGLTQYFYEGGRLVFPGLVILAGMLYCLTLTDKRAHLKGLVWMLLVALVVAAPVYTTLAAHEAVILPRLYNESIEPRWYFSLLTYADGQGAWLKERFLNPLLLYFARPDANWFYGGHEALILPAIAPFFLLGIGCLFWRPRSPTSLLLLPWLLLTVLGNSFLRESASSPRYVVIFPALMLVTAVGLWYTLRFLTQALTVKMKPAVVSGLIVTLIAVGQVVYYFHDHLPVFTEQMRQPEAWEDALFRLEGLPAGTQVHFIMDEPVRYFNVNAFVRYWQFDVQVDAQAVDEVSDGYLQSLDPTVQHMFFVNEAKHDILTLIRRYFVLSSPEYSAYDLPLHTQLMLYRASPIPK